MGAFVPPALASGLASFGSAGGDAIAALELLRERAPAMPVLLVGTAVAAAAIGNVPGIAHARSNWAAIAQRLDGGWKQEVGTVAAMSRADWMGDDRDRFEHVLDRLIEETEAVRAYFGDIAKHLDEIHDILLGFQIELGIIAAVVAVYSAILIAMLATPLAPWGESLLQVLGTAATEVIIAMTSKVAGIIALIGAVIAAGLPNALQFGWIEASGAAKVDFTKVTLDTAPPSSYIEPKRNVPEPYRAPVTVRIPPGSGMTLWDIAEKQYGDGRRWPTIYAANKNVISDPNMPPEGIDLTIPPKP